MPVTSTLVLGQQYSIVNNSTGVVTVQSSGANTIQKMAANSILILTVINTGVTTAAGWNVNYAILGGIVQPIVTTFTNSGTWSKAATTQTVDLILVGGGGGGKTGSTGSSGSAAGGSAGGDVLLISGMPSSVFGSSETVTIGTGVK